MSTLGTSPPPTAQQQSSGTTEQAKEKVKDTAQQAKGQARGRLSQQVDQRSTTAGEQVASTASDVRSVAEQLREQGKEQPAKLAEQAADRAEQLGDYLKNADGDALLRDVENFGRRQPWAVMFGGLAAGFLASRFLKASSSRRYESSQSTMASRPSPAPMPPRATTTSPGAAPVPRVADVDEPITGTPAERVSPSGGVMPPGTAGATRPAGPAGGTGGLS